jgi:hypothetical protein
MWHVWFWWGSLKKSDSWENIGVDENIIFILILEGYGWDPAGSFHLA